MKKVGRRLWHDNINSAIDNVAQAQISKIKDWEALNPIGVIVKRQKRISRFNKQCYGRC